MVSSFFLSGERRVGNGARGHAFFSSPPSLRFLPFVAVFLFVLTGFRNARFGSKTIHRSSLLFGFLLLLLLLFGCLFLIVVLPVQLRLLLLYVNYPAVGHHSLPELGLPLFCCCLVLSFSYMYQYSTLFFFFLWKSKRISCIGNVIDFFFFFSLSPWSSSTRAFRFVCRSRQEVSYLECIQMNTYTHFLSLSTFSFNETKRDRCCRERGTFHDTLLSPQRS